MGERKTMKHLPNLRLLSTKFVIFFVGAFLVLPYSNITPSLEAKNIKPAKRKHVHVDQKQLKCLTYNVYYEARGESDHGKAAVARVVMNRVKHGFAPTPCKVIYQTITVQKTTYDQESDTLNTRPVKVCQFSWVCESERKLPNKKSAAFKKSENIAYQVLANDAYKTLVSANTLFFHNMQVSPNWNYRKTKEIGNHVFYEKPKKKLKPTILASTE